MIIRSITATDFHTLLHRLIPNPLDLRLIPLWSRRLRPTVLTAYRFRLTSILLTSQAIPDRFLHRPFRHLIFVPLRTHGTYPHLVSIPMALLEHLL